MTAEQELSQIKQALADPDAVWTNMLRGTIARPPALDHYEECKSELEKVTAERDAARADLKAIGECVGGDPLAVRGLVESMDAVIKERDAALKACAQKDDALQDCSQFPLGESLHYKVCSALDDNTCGKDFIPRSELDKANAKCAEMRNLLVESPQPWSAGQSREWLKRREHALSTNCGKGYHSAAEWAQVVEALQRCIERLDDAHHHQTLKMAREAIAHAESLLKK